MRGFEYDPWYQLKNKQTSKQKKIKDKKRYKSSVIKRNLEEQKKHKNIFTY